MGACEAFDLAAIPDKSSYWHPNILKLTAKRKK